MTDLLERAAWTASETFLAVLVAAGVDFVDLAVWKTAAVAAGAAALSAFKTAIQQRRAANAGV